MFFSDQQRADLREHLSTRLSGQALDDAIPALEHACADARFIIDYFPVVLERRVHRAKFAHYQNVFAAATRLKQLLAEAPKVDKSTLVDAPLHWELSGFDWDAFNVALARVISSAGTHSEDEGKHAIAGRGRPTVEWRNRLFTVACQLYPDTALNDPHLQATCEILLDMLTTNCKNPGKIKIDDVQNLPQKILTAIERCIGF